MRAKIGEVYGKLTVIGEPISKNGLKYPVQCSCGSSPYTINITQLKYKGKINGGCKLCTTWSRTHGHGSSRNPTYSKYQAMKQRCTNPKHKGWDRYGGRGIKVCDRWLESFESFLADMGESPAGMSIERIETDGNYEPGNCKWATDQEQAENTSRCTKIEYGGVKYPTVSAFCKAHGIRTQHSISRRLKEGKTIEEIMKNPPKQRPWRQNPAEI